MVFKFNLIDFVSRLPAIENESVSSPADQSYHSAQADFAPTLSLSSGHLLIFRYRELIEATGNFSQSSKIGDGVLGSLYETDIMIEYSSDTKLRVMVKRLNEKGHKEWAKALDILGVVEHPNLVKLVGYSNEVSENESLWLLVYELMANKSVEYHLSTRSQASLSWTIRLKLAQDAACGLAHLHEKMIPFGVFKSSNIFLDDQWNAKLSYFGLAYDEETDVSTMMADNMGYVAPECFQRGCHLPDCDTWGYGVFLYELITGRRPGEVNHPQNEQKLLEWVKPYVDSNRLAPIIDPRLEDNYSLDSVHNLCIIANKCLAGKRNLRPKMSEVLEMVNKLTGVPLHTSCPAPPLKSPVPVFGTITLKKVFKCTSKCA